MSDHFIYPSVFDLDLEEIMVIAQNWGEAKYRARQLWEGLYQKFVSDPDQISNLPNSFQEKLSSHYSFNRLRPFDLLESTDGQTSKVLFELPDGNQIETVLMNYDNRHTLCISSQAGCAMNCSFCATGQMGFFRNLSAGEIVEQVLYFARKLKESGEYITNIVYMGMGEPFHNYHAVMKSFRILNHPDGFNLGARRFTISTVGLIPGIEKFTQENTQINLAISLHTTDNERRSSIMPVNVKYPIKDLIAACHKYFSVTGRRVSFEWGFDKGCKRQH
jgi:23S rRNA (adenine2503-C2)-methyltransferase